MIMQYFIVTSETDIGIQDISGKYVLYWDKLEWEQDPTVVLSIVNAIKLAVEDSEQFEITLKELVL